MRLSYSCMSNIKTLIGSHNNKILNQDNKTEPECNCKDKQLCPMINQKDSCRTKDVIYRATVESDSGTKYYIGLTSTEIKKRISKHQTDFRNKKYEKSTELSKHIWKLKDRQEQFKLKWEVISRARSLRNGDKVCRLCVREASLILQADKRYLNKRKEIASTCRHRRKYLLKNIEDRNND